MKNVLSPVRAGMLVTILLGSLIVAKVTIANCTTVGATTTCDSSAPNPPANDVEGSAGNDTIVIESGAVVADDGDADDDAIAANGGSDTVTNNGTVDGDLEGGDGDDTLTNNGDITDDFKGGSGNDVMTNSSTGDIVWDIEGDDGDDVITNDGTVGGYIDGGAGNDSIINNNQVVDGLYGDDTAGDGGDDTIINNGVTDYVVGDYADGTGGHDILINNGTAFIISGDESSGDGGDDTIINNGNAFVIVGDEAYDPFCGCVVSNGGDDLIINQGTVLIIVGDAASGDGGDDTIINNGTAGFIIGDDVGGEGGNDRIINNGEVVGDIDAEGGDDVVIIRFGSLVGGTIYGGETGETNGDVLTFTDLTDAIASSIAAQCPDPDAGCTISVNGVVYNVAEFESLSLLLKAIERQLEEEGIIPPAPGLTCDNGAVKVFRTPNDSLEVYSGFNLLAPNGFLVAVIPGDQLQAGNAFSNPSAPVAGWSVLLGSARQIVVFDANGNPVNADCVYRD